MESSTRRQRAYLPPLTTRFSNTRSLTILPLLSRPATVPTTCLHRRLRGIKPAVTVRRHDLAAGTIPRAVSPSQPPPLIPSRGNQEDIRLHQRRHGVLAGSQGEGVRGADHHSKDAARQDLHGCVADVFL